MIANVSWRSGHVLFRHLTDRASNQSAVPRHCQCSDRVYIHIHHIYVDTVLDLIVAVRYLCQDRNCWLLLVSNRPQYKET